MGCSENVAGPLRLFSCTNIPVLRILLCTIDYLHSLHHSAHCLSVHNPHLVMGWLQNWLDDRLSQLVFELRCDHLFELLTDFDLFFDFLLFGDFLPL